MRHPIVIDNGSGQIKAGIASEDSPRSIFPTIVGIPRTKKAILDKKCKTRYVGQDTKEREAMLMLRHPIENGIIVDWDSMELIWRYTFTQELRVDPEGAQVMMTEAPLNPKSHREKMISIMFEAFEVQEYFILLKKTFKRSIQS